MNTNSAGKYTAKDLHDMKFHEIEDIQRSYDSQNVATVNAAFVQQRINKKERDFLLNIYQDGMSFYSQVYDVWCELLGDPIYTTAFNIHTGEVDRAADGKTIDYTPKVLTPFVNTRVKFFDKNNNAIYVIFPKMKSASRAIEKLEKEYAKDYCREFTDALDAGWEAEDREVFWDKLSNVKPKIMYLHDIVRLTVTCKYLSDVERFERKLYEHQEKGYNVNKSETRNRFKLPLSKNKKKYYDIKMIMHQKSENGYPFDTEVQLKIDTLYRADLRTHEIYERARKIQDLMSDQNPDEVNEKLQKSIDMLDNNCRIINENAIHEYNMIVLDKVFRIIDTNFRPRRKKPDVKGANGGSGTYERCNKFIEANYLVESYDDFNPLTAFAKDSMVNRMCFLKLIGMLPKNFDELSEDAPRIIEEKFAPIFDESNSGEYKKYHHIRRQYSGIMEVAANYASVIQQKIEKRRMQDTKETSKYVVSRGRRVSR